MVRNRSILCQRQLPSHFTQAIIDLIDKKDEHYNLFLANLGPNAEQFLEENGVVLGPSNLLNALPAEILSNTLEFLNKDDQLSFAATDKYNRAFIVSEKGYRELERPINLISVKLNDKIVNDDDKFEAFLTYLKSSRCEIESLDVSDIDLGRNRYSKWFRLIEALSENKTVTDLNLSRCGLSSYSCSLCVSPKDGVLMLKIRSLINLKSLNLSGNDISDLDLWYLDKLNKLERLDISNNKCAISPYIVEEQLTKLSKLESLNFSGNYFDGLFMAKSICKFSDQLKVLIIHNCIYYDYEGI
ncbi:MAG: leucine-rich repeat domain-containing protein, partial [Burkholderiales bacterium]